MRVSEQDAVARKMVCCAGADDRKLWPDRIDEVLGIGGLATVPGNLENL
jgi:hypothetical protein